MKKTLTGLIAFFLGIISAASLFVVFTVCMNGSTRNETTESQSVSAPVLQSQREEGAASAASAENAASVPASVPQPTPEPTPEPKWYDKHVQKLQLQGNVLIPEDIYFLDEPEVKTVLGKKGVCIYELSEPYKEAPQLGKIDNGTQVTVLARQNGYALFCTGGGLYAWGANQLIVDENDTPYLVSGKSGDGYLLTMVNNNKVYVLYDPFCIFPHMSTMEPGTTVTAYRTVNGFTYVESGSAKGWVASKYLG